MSRDNLSARCLPALWEWYVLMRGILEDSMNLKFFKARPESKPNVFSKVNCNALF